MSCFSGQRYFVMSEAPATGQKGEVQEGGEGWCTLRGRFFFCLFGVFFLGPVFLKHHHLTTGLNPMQDAFLPHAADGARGLCFAR